MIYLLTIIILSSALLNRLRGTGLIYHFFDFNFSLFGKFQQVVKVNLVWNHIYGLYLASLVYYLTESYLYSSLTLVAYLVGEAKGWGEWVGALTRWENKNSYWLEEQYRDNEGKKFPFIHQIANYIQPEIIAGNLTVRLNQYHKYARLALSLRGYYWWMPVYIVMYFADIISITSLIVIPLVLAFLFPLACEIGKRLNFSFKFLFLSLNRGWENQELVYGVFQGIALATAIYL